MLLLEHHHHRRRFFIAPARPNARYRNNLRLKFAAFVLIPFFFPGTCPRTSRQCSAHFNHKASTVAPSLNHTQQYNSRIATQCGPCQTHRLTFKVKPGDSYPRALGSLEVETSPNQMNSVAMRLSTPCIRVRIHASYYCLILRTSASTSPKSFKCSIPAIPDITDAGVETKEPNFFFLVVDVLCGLGRCANGLP